MTLFGRLIAALGLALATACGGSEAEPPTVDRRVIAIDLWAGAGGQVTGPAPAIDPVDGGPIEAWVRTSRDPAGERRQVLTVTQGGAALGRVLDQRPGLPEQRFAGDAVFPLGLWHAGERRDFTAAEITLVGPAERRITLQIMDLDFVHQGAEHALRYRVEVRDLAGRLLSCEISVYVPGRGLVDFRASTLWRGGAAC